VAEYGRLITFEGIDGSGKSTQAGIFYGMLKEEGVSCALLREPGGTAFGEAVREILLKGKGVGGQVVDFGRQAEALLFLSARAELVRQVIKPLLGRGCIVLLDRFIDSTVAYQGHGRGLDITELKRLNDWATEGFRPDLTLLIDLDPQKALARLAGGFDRMEEEGAPFMQRVREGYLELARREPERIRVIDGAASIEEIAARVREAAQPR